MKMTSKGTLLLTLAGVVGFGCSAPDDGNDPAPTNAPPYFGQPQTQQPLNPAPGGQVGAAGAPSTPVGGAAGSGSTPVGGTAGSGGMMAGAAGAGGMMPGMIPTGTGLALTPVGGWVAGTTNEVGIQGSFFPLTDADGMPPGATIIMPTDFSTAMGPNICVSGTASQVMNDAAGAADYPRYWGGGLAFNLADPGNMIGPMPWARGRVVGFSFTISGTQIPPAGQFRFGINFYEGAAVNQDSCVNIQAGANEIRFEEVVNECWGAAAPPLPATAMLQSLKWQVATVTTAPTPFNFCVENLRAIVE